MLSSSSLFCVVVVDSLQELPNSIGGMSSLVSLNIDENLLTSLPSKVHTHTNIVYADYYNCLLYYNKYMYVQLYIPQLIHLICINLLIVY